MQYAVGIQSASGLLACDSPSTFKCPFRSPREAGVASGPPATAAFTPAYGFLEGPRIEIVTATFNPAPPVAGADYRLLITGALPFHGGASSRFHYPRQIGGR